MESEGAIDALHALAHPGRLAVLRLLIRAGRDGLPAGEIARTLDTHANSMSAQLAVLSRAGLIRSKRQSRSIIYAVSYEQVAQLLGFLLEDCCAGSREVCAPLAELMGRLTACPPARSRPQEVTS